MLKALSAEGCVEERKRLQETYQMEAAADVDTEAADANDDSEAPATGPQVGPALPSCDDLVCSEARGSSAFGHLLCLTPHLMSYSTGEGRGLDSGA